MNLTDYAASEVLKIGYDSLNKKLAALGKTLPQNKNIKRNQDLLLRNLDCAVVQEVHELNRSIKCEPYDSVRGVFLEGDSIYENSGFHEKTHIQLCVINPNCIKGYFSPLEVDLGYKIP